MTIHAKARDTTNRLFYEWWMLTEAESKILQSPLDRATRNAWIESGAIHARNLKEFLYHARTEGRSRDDDVFAGDLVQQTNWTAARPPASATLNRPEFGDAVNKQVAHFTRTGDTKKEWNVSAVADALQPAVECFFVLLPLDDLGERWRTELTQMRGPRWDGLKRILAERGLG